MTSDDLTQQPLVPDTRPMLEQILQGIEEIKRRMTAIETQLVMMNKKLDRLAADNLELRVRMDMLEEKHAQ